MIFPPGSCGLCHFPAGAGTSPAGLCTLLHHFVIAKALAVFCTPLADISTDTTCLPVKLGHAQHEIGAGLADLGAVQEQLDVPGLCMLSSHLKTVADGFHANIMAMVTFLDAFPHPLVDHRIHSDTPLYVKSFCCLNSLLPWMRSRIFQYISYQEQNNGETT
jgi:hypothetical protein